MVANNGSGVAIIENDKLVVYNNSLVAKVYAVEEEQIVDVTDANAALIDSLKASAEANIKYDHAKDIKGLDKLDTTGSTLIDLQSANCVVTAVKFADGKYGFVARPYGYGNDCMVVYYVLDAKGAIVSMKADEFILIAEYFTNYTLNEKDYKASFEGLTVDTFGEQYLITGATVSSDAMKSATNAVFEAFAAITGGNN